VVLFVELVLLASDPAGEAISTLGDGVGDGLVLLGDRPARRDPVSGHGHAGRSPHVGRTSHHGTEVARGLAARVLFTAPARLFRAIGEPIVGTAGLGLDLASPGAPHASVAGEHAALPEALVARVTQRDPASEPGLGLELTVREGGEHVLSRCAQHRIGRGPRPALHARRERIGDGGVPHRVLEIEEWIARGRTRLEGGGGGRARLLGAVTRHRSSRRRRGLSTSIAGWDRP